MDPARRFGTMRTLLIFLAILLAFAGYGQNQRVTTLTITAGATNNGPFRVQSGVFTAAGGSLNSGGNTNSNHERNTGWVEDSGGSTNKGTTATSQQAPLQVLGVLSFPPVTNVTLAVNLATNTSQVYTTNASFTVTHTGTAPDGARIEFRVWNTASADITLTIPASYSESQGAGITSINLVSNSVTRVIWRFESGSNYVNVIQKDAFQLGILSPSVGQVLKVHCTSCGPGGSMVFTNAADADSGGATAWNAIGDAAADATVAFAGFQQTISSTLNGGAILTLTNLTTDNSADTFGLFIAFNDSTDANSIFARFVDDADGTPVNSYTFGPTVFAIGTSVQTTFNGATAVPTTSANDNDTSAASTAFVQGEINGVTNIVEFAFGETNVLATGTGLLKWRAPHAMTVVGLRASLSTTSSSGIPTVDINETGTTIISTKLTIDAGETTSTTAAAAAVISDAAIADDAEITFDIDVAGTGAAGLKVKIYYTR